jgi:hypothetical protein
LADQRKVVLSLCQQCQENILYPLAIPSSRAGDTMEASAQQVSSLPAAASMSGEETVMPESTLEEITAKILDVERQIKSTSDAEEKKQLQDREKQLRDEKKQLRDKENLLLRLQLKGTTSGKFSILLGGGGGGPNWYKPERGQKQEAWHCKKMFFHRKCIRDDAS